MLRLLWGASARLSLALACFLHSCVLLPGYGGPPRPAAGPEAAPPSPWKDLRGVIHCHSHLSHDSRGTPEEIAAAADAVGLDFLIMTDHYTDRGIEQAMRGFHGRTLFLPGAECRKEGKRFLALGIEKPLELRRPWNEIHAQIREQGGLLFLDHFEDYGEDLADISFDGIEIHNLHSAAELTNPFLLLLRGLLLPPHAVFPSLCWLHEENLRRWEKALRSRPVPIVAGNDAHENIRLLGPLGGIVGSYEQLFRTVTTHVWAKDNSREAILDALREGRSYVAFEWLADATGFQVTTAEEQGRARCRIFAPQTARIVLRRNGKAVAESHGQWLDAPLDLEEANYRVEVYLREKIWILAGVYFTPRKTAT